MILIILISQLKYDIYSKGAGTPSIPFWISTELAFFTSTMTCALWCSRSVLTKISSSGVSIRLCVMTLSLLQRREFVRYLMRILLQKDLEYWQIDELILEPCCALKYYPEIELCVKEQKGEQEAKAKENQRLKDENFGTSSLGKVRTYLWNVMEYPETSRTAQVMNGKMRLTPELFAVVHLPFSQLKFCSKFLFHLQKGKHFVFFETVDPPR